MKTLAITSILGLALVAGPAAAQLAQSSKAPMDITADELETQNADCVSIWKGNVEALQDQSRLRTDLLRVFFEKASKSGSNSTTCGAVKRIEAEGSVYYVTPQQRVHGDHAVYVADSDTITVTGDVVAAQGQNVLRGERMVIDNKTGQGHMETSVRGRNKPGRVRGVFYPNQSNSPQGGQQGAAPAKSPPRK